MPAGMYHDVSIQLAIHKNLSQPIIIIEYWFAEEGLARSQCRLLITIMNGVPKSTC